MKPRLCFMFGAIILGLFFCWLPKFQLVNAANDKVPPGCMAAGIIGNCIHSGWVQCSGGWFGAGVCCPNAAHCSCVNQSGYVYTALGCLPAGDFNEFAGWFVSKAIYIASGAAFLFMVYGGFLLLTSAGDPNKVKAGTELISAALSGLLFIIVSALLLKIIGVNILNLPGF